MKIRIVILLLNIFLYLNVFAMGGGGGTDIGSGGDLVKCAPYHGNDLFGLYSLDYLVFASGKESISLVKSWQESLYNIRRTMVDKIPELLPFFDEYINDILNVDQSRRYVWEATEYELTEIDDENLPTSVQIPVNCRENGKLQIVQAVIRQNPTFTGSKLIVFKYMPKIFEKMASEKPLQLSYLLVHEFLWSISSNVDRNRRINWFLHSSEFQSLPRFEVINRLLGIGLNIKEIPRILDMNGGGHFTTLQDALSKVRANETLIVKEGVYSTGGASFITPIKLIGQGDRSKIILKGTDHYPALDIAVEQGESVEVQNITIKRMINVKEDPLDGIMYYTFNVTSGKLKIENSKIVGNSYGMIRLRGDVELSLINSDIQWGYRGLMLDEFYGTLIVQENRFLASSENPKARSAVVTYYSVEPKVADISKNVFESSENIVDVRGDQKDFEYVKTWFSNNSCPFLKSIDSKEDYPFCKGP